VTYFQRVHNTYRDALIGVGVSEDVINFCLFAFETGFNCGILYNEDIEIQEQMIKTLIEKEIN
jgi:hypothetical protein